MNEIVDIIIPTYRPDDKLLTLLDKLNKQTLKPNKIWLINTEKSYFDAFTSEENLCKKHPNVSVTHITKQEFDHAATREKGVRMSEAPFFVMMTDDAIPADEHLLENLIRPLAENEKIGVSYARQLANKDATLIEKFTRQHNYPSEAREKTQKDLDILGIKTYFFSDVCAAYKKQLFMDLGGYVPTAIFNEDMLFAAKVIKVGLSVYYAADAKVYHSHNYGGIQQLKRNFDLGVSQSQHAQVFENLPSESAGIAMVKKTAAYLVKKKRPWLIVSLIWLSGCKYIGYRLGKAYERLPMGMVMKLTSNPGYWKH